MGCCLTHMHDLIWDFCPSDQRFARELVYSSHPASFRFHLTMDTLAFGYILPTTGRIRDFNPLETCAARRTTHKTGGTQPKLSAACFVVQSCLADADFVVFSNYCLIGTRQNFCFLSKYLCRSLISYHSLQSLHTKWILYLFYFLSNFIQFIAAIGEHIWYEGKIWSWSLP